MLFLLFINGVDCRFENSIKNIIKSICKIFMGKYIWKQIGLIFTHYGYDVDTQADVKETGNKMMKKILEIAENEYKEIIKNQNQNNKTCDPNEKIVKSLNCFYVNSKKKGDGQYDLHSLEEIEKIKNFVENLMPIDKVQSKFIVSKKLLKDQKSDISKELIKVKDKGVLAGLKTLGCYALGVTNAIYTPAYALLGGASKLISLPFEDDSVFNKFSQNCMDTIEYTSVCFNELPDQVNTKVVGAKASYILYDLEIFT